MKQILKKIDDLIDILLSTQTDANDERTERLEQSSIILETIKTLETLKNRIEYYIEKKKPLV